ncbi:hypothetical protein E2562_018753 [Oryza meyeriana var. granulata]|uniref:Uncharacterized protein n=1 Tax=Oryza meyeriana var. granulata TaxID=110450 RepID=A0A6G1EMV5_9ORYZ|nr:hypothetical protein E2562_018753 [Oryza meyeriana var. granulata]
MPREEPVLNALTLTRPRTALEPIETTPCLAASNPRVELCRKIGGSPKTLLCSPKSPGALKAEDKLHKITRGNSPKMAGAAGVRGRRFIVVAVVLTTHVTNIAGHLRAIGCYGHRHR